MTSPIGRRSPTSPPQRPEIDARKPETTEPATAETPAKPGWKPGGTKGLDNGPSTPRRPPRRTFED